MPWMLLVLLIILMTFLCAIDARRSNKEHIDRLIHHWEKGDK
jgi:preprotein translocase subunit YajC